jgi:hypothetical protein
MSNNNNNTLKMLVFIALATVMAGAVAATVIPAQQADAQSQGKAPECPTQSPSGGGNPSIQHGCGPIR